MTLAFCSDSLRGAAVEHTPREASVRLATRWPCLALVALCCLLALATSASAEGAWVLRKHEVIVAPDAKTPKEGSGDVGWIEWTKVGVKSSRKDCEELLGGTAVPSRDVYHICLPDTGP